MESGCSTVGNPLAEARELREAERAQQPSTSAPRTLRGGLAPTAGLAEAQCSPASSPWDEGMGTARDLLPVSHALDCISRQRKMRGGEDKEKESKEPNREEKKKKSGGHD